MQERKSKKQKMSRDAREGRSTHIGLRERLRIVKRKKKKSENQREKYLGVKNYETNTSYTKWENEIFFFIFQKYELICLTPRSTQPYPTQPIILASWISLNLFSRIQKTLSPTTFDPSYFDFLTNHV